MHTRSLTIFLLLALSGLLMADDAGVALHTNPAVDAPVMATIPQDAYPLLPSTPVGDPALAEQGWREVLYGGGVSGFVELSELRGATLAKGAPVHFDPDHESPVITTFEQGDLVEIRSRGPWSGVFIKKPLRLYAQATATQATGGQYDVEPIPAAQDVATAVDEVPAEAAEPFEATDATAEANATNPSPTPSAKSSGGVLEAVVRDQDAPQDAPQDQAAPEPAPMVEVAPVSQPSTDSAPARLSFIPSAIPGQGAVVIDPNPVDSPNFFEGRLQRTRSFLFWRHPFEYQLVGPDGKRLWYLDDSQMLKADPLVSYLGEKVVVHGMVEKASERGGLVIRAKHLR